MVMLWSHYSDIIMIIILIHLPCTICLNYTRHPPLPVPHIVDPQGCPSNGKVFFVLKPSRVTMQPANH